MFGKAGLGGLMQQAQKMQDNMKKAQAELAKVKATCGHVVTRLDISPDLIAEAADDKEMLEDLILAAIADAHEKAEQTTAARMAQFTQGLPPGFGDFFK